MEVGPFRFFDCLKSLFCIKEFIGFNMDIDTVE